LWAEKKKSRPGKKDWAERERKEGIGVLEVSPFFQIPFSNFANFTQTIKLCIRIMMHKHLLIIKLLK
jgi:hypothetical protein